MVHIMKTIEIQLQSTTKQTTDKTTVTLSCRLKNGKQWTSESLRPNKEGIATLTVSDAQWKQLAWRSMRFEVTRNGERVAIEKTEGPAQVNENTVRVTLTVKLPDQQENQPDREPQVPATDPPAPPVAAQSDTEPSDSKQPDVEQPEGAGMDVSGQIRSANGRPVAGYYVVAFDRDICDEVILGHVRSGEDGRYRIPYKPEQLTTKEKQQADLIVRVFDNDNFEADPAASSPVIIRAGAQETVDLSIGDETYRGLSVFEQTQDRLADLLQKKPWDCIESADIWLLADRTGMRPARIAQFVRANQIASTAGKTAQQREAFALLFFALFRAGFSFQPRSLMRQPDRLLRRALVRAIRANWIPALDDIGAVIEALRQPRVDQVLADDPDSKQLLSLAGLNANQQKTALNHFLAAEDISEATWKALESKPGFSRNKVNALRDTVEMNTITGGDLRLLAGARRDHKVRSPRDLAVLTREDWTKLVESEMPELPGTVDGPNREKRIQNYATAVTLSVEARYPTAVVASRWQADGDLPQTHIQTFFKQNPDFDFTRASVQQQLAGKTSNSARQQLQSMNQVESLFHVAPEFDRFDHIKTLWQGGLRSADDITRMGRTTFRRQYAPNLGGTQAADEVYARAQHTTAYNLSLVPKTSKALNSLDLAVMPALAAVLAEKNEPTWDTLFGSTTVVGCEHCQSALSPGAYLVDLLDFLSRATDGQSGTGLEYLHQGRRPDIPQVKLTCANSDTVMPYIDLVLEVLENVVAPQPGFAPQTTRTSAELLAEPEHVNLQAYDPLKTAMYPWVLPFDLDFALTRTYLAQMGVPATN
jgi:hypothetical protein